MTLEYQRWLIRLSTDRFSGDVTRVYAQHIRRVIVVDLALLTETLKQISPRLQESLQTSR